MSRALVLYLLLLGAGIACLVAGLSVTRRHWRADVAPFGRRSRMFQIALHPELYAQPGHLGLIRTLNGIGALLLAGALGVVGHDVWSAVAGH